jgi:acetyl esterase
MSAAETPLLQPGHGTPGDRALRWSLSLAIRGSLLFSPRPAALMVRKVFALGGAKTAAVLEKHAPTDVVALIDERYGDGPDTLLDVFRPASASSPLPLLLWAHGGGFVGGSKDELAGYFKLVAGNGYVVAAPRYSLAPEHHYPAPLRQLMQALEYLQANAERLLIDVDYVAAGGDSAGAHIAAQLAALVTTPGYADAVGVTPAVTARQLRGLVLACGPYDLGLARTVDNPAGRRLIQVVLWAYSGNRHFLDDPAFAQWSVADYVTPAFPPALVTVGNADPLRAHSELLVQKLQAQGVETEALFFPGDYAPPLGHEYQFDLDSEAGQRFLEHALAFLRRRLAQAQRRA